VPKQKTWWAFLQLLFWATPLLFWTFVFWVAFHVEGLAFRFKTFAVNTTNRVEYRLYWAENRLEMLLNQYGDSLED